MWSVAGTAGPASGTIDEQMAAASFVSNGNSYLYLNRFFTPTGTTLTLTIAYPAAANTGGNYIEAVAASLDLASDLKVIPTVQDGNWSDPATWAFGIIPSGSQDARINNNVSVTSDTTIGDGTATTVLDCTNGTLTVRGATLTIRGDATFGLYTEYANRLTIESSGATPGGIELDGNAGVAPVISFADDVLVVITGTAAAPCFVETDANTAGDPGYLTSTANYRSWDAIVSYCNFSRVGDATHPGLASPVLDGRTPDADFTFDHCTFTACGGDIEHGTRPTRSSRRPAAT